MGDVVVRIGPVLAVVVVLLAAVAIAVNYFGRTRRWRQTSMAIVRATAQLALLAIVLGAVIHRLSTSIAFLVLMACVASWTSAGRITDRRATFPHSVLCLLPVAAATTVVITAVVGVGVLPPAGLALIPTAGIMFGGAMNTTSLAGRYAHHELFARRGEVEAALSLGLPSREARLEICRDAGTTALIPGIDQTRSVGLVTIPGAFVGMILGGASPTVAAIMQLFVLIALLAVSATAAVITIEMVAREIL